MGLFKRVECNEEAEQPSMSAAELEQMVYATYQEKLDLAKRLDSAKARIESLEESLQEKTTKLRAAEEFARQSESERKSNASKIEPLEQSKKQLQANLKQEKARAATLEVRLGEWESASRGRMDAYRRELIEEMQRQAASASGGWSKARVLSFLGGFLDDAERRRAARNARRGTDPTQAQKRGAAATRTANAAKLWPPMKAGEVWHTRLNAI